MQLIVTRPGFLKGIERLANSDAPIASVATQSQSVSG